MNARKILQTFEVIAHEVAVGDAHVTEPTPETRREARLLLDYARNRLAEIRCHPTDEDAESNDPEPAKPARREVMPARPADPVAVSRFCSTSKRSN